MKVCVLAGSSSYFNDAEIIANNLGFSFFKEIVESKTWRQEIKRLSSLLIPFQAVLIVEEKGLSLLPLLENGAVIQGMAPIYIDFTNSVWARRLYNISSKKELAAKALGLHKKDAQYVFDANAGLGQDSFVFAALGAQVFACERSPLVHCLLSDALARARQDKSIATIAQRIELVRDDAIERIARAELGDCHSIYLDPMFPDKKHQALAKKEMQVFQRIIGPDQDAELLFNEALNYLYSTRSENASCRRVVLKRPRLAPVLSQEKLGRQVEGNSTRFDIYFKS